MRIGYKLLSAGLLGLALITANIDQGNAQPQTPGVDQKLVGTWLLVSEITTFPDGRKLEGFGGNQKGILMFDGAGHYASQLTGDSRVKFGSSRLQGTPEENKGVSAGSLAHFGTYSVDSAGSNLTYHVERSSFRNWDDTDQNWSIMSASPDELKLGVARTSSGGSAVLVWKRAR
jgi:Lipocalin-like domain